MVVKKFGQNLAATGHGTIVQVRVAAGSSKAAVDGFDEWNACLKVRLRSKAEKGKANQELLKALKEFFGAEVEIAKGEKSRQKKVLVHAEKSRVEERLSSL